jgi:NADPH2:quinone reductase
MRAVLVSEFGGPEQLRLGESADPVAGPGQVRIAVHVAGVNPVDAGNRADGGWAGLRLPCILGYDVAGVIDGVGEGVRGLAAGERVMAMTHFPGGAGGYAERVVTGAGLAAPISPATTFAEAAAAPLAAGTAQVVLSRLALPAASRLLVLGASGGVGLFLLQLAAAAGITTIGVGRQARHDLMRGLGAAACIDYMREDLAPRALTLAGGPVDAIADSTSPAARQLTTTDSRRGDACRATPPGTGIAHHGGTPRQRLNHLMVGTFTVGQAARLHRRPVLS